ncbi:UDP-N-acetylmuramate dehydrogenase [Pseudoalteromonas ruthenica]|uniref:UDP-N-acetylenolpyruvoylglucosamine reductase n=1 Tax=Pseudoalteromonas ruthenica TaxID=151081 RepID=A0A0F4PQF4_9GAMM|nr:UDP-N-acetylmuramate dehydrogenase [Pseudoalteromonas ruthenica]KJY97283.1 UDP-N-acetylenolpyruvoylglucosamine reductase [Pseudoalteromonas ruthenica]KJY99231.1 UDP-N-acetylenolpyruvoylglucosamine reductase [Pseudoalteromonas ruthenica]TMO86315.1 UDP-N-acetylmuramate dehydrogenase [Pseudoalteromonas ruthenica]TMO91052.1 UDP-N-acetylmuramate dehydrogenase [Pseudoalteromonas ruthenica]TMO98487.1 UDP-N-acetylmuramate dehydrogenase [Pseudoalteromonas ruthenica]
MPALQCLHTFALAAQCQQLLTIEDAEQLHDVDFSQPFCVLGEGSNTIFTAPYQGSVLLIANKGLVIEEDSDAWLLHCEAGENWHQLVQQSLALAMPGLENLALIPGTVGAAPVQNIGAYGVELAQFVDYVQGFDIAERCFRNLSAKECEFGYRDSIFKHALKERFIITRVGLRLPKAWQANTSYGPLQALHQPTAQQIFEQVVAVRQSKLPDPYQLANSGSFFKNPILTRQHVSKLRQSYADMPCYDVDSQHQKVAAGWLIEQAGLKGYHIGDIAVHDKQALVLVNRGAGTAEQLMAMIKHIQQTIVAQFGIALEHEVRLLGAQGEIHVEAENESA